MTTRAATTEALHLLLTTPSTSLAGAIRRYEDARDHVNEVTSLGWELIAADLRQLGADSEAALDRATSCDERAGKLVDHATIDHSDR